MHVRVNVNRNDAYIQGRNGMAKLIAVDIWGDIETVFIDGICSKGIAVNGGLGNIPTEQMDELALKWIKTRGLVVDDGDGGTLIDGNCPECGKETLFKLMSGDLIECVACGIELGEEDILDRNHES